MPRQSYPVFKLISTPGRRHFGIGIDHGPTANPRCFGIATGFSSKRIALAVIELMNAGATVAKRSRAVPMKGA